MIPARGCLGKMHEEHCPDRLYEDIPSTASTPTFIRAVTSKITDLSLSDETHINTCHRGT